MREPTSLSPAPGGSEQALAGWLEAHEMHDDRAALRLAAAFPGAPLALRLCLPGCWRRACGSAGFEGFVDALVAAAAGPERALIAVAAARLHPAALLLAGTLAPGDLLLAAAEGALLAGQVATARRWLACCEALAPEGGWRARLASIEAARADAGERAAREPGAAIGAPAGPGARIAGRLLDLISPRVRAALGRGRPHEALGWLELGIEAATASRPAATPPAARLIEASDLRALLGRTAEAAEALDRAESSGLSGGSGIAGGGGGGGGGGAMDAANHPAVDSSAIPLRRARLALEQDDPTGAIAWLAPLIEEEAGPSAPAEEPGRAEAGRRGPAAALGLRGVAAAALGRWEEAEGWQHAALTRLREGGQEEGEEAASCLHWLGIGRLVRGELAEAEALLGRAGELRSEALWPDHPDQAGSLVALGGVLAARGRLAEAERRYREALARLRRSLGGGDHRTLLATARLADLLMTRHRWAEAEPLVLGLLEQAARSGHEEERGRWREASERVRMARGEQAGGGGQGGEEEPLAEAVGTAPLDDEGLLRRLGAFAGYVVLVHRQSGGLLTLVDHEGYANGAVVFTEEAQADAFLAQAPGEVRGWFELMTMDGHTLFGLLPGQRVDGLIFNPLGPWPRAAPASLGAAALRCL